MDRRLGGLLPHQLANPTRVHLIPPEFFTLHHAMLCAYAVYEYGNLSGSVGDMILSLAGYDDTVTEQTVNGIRIKIDSGEPYFSAADLRTKGIIE